MPRRIDIELTSALGDGTWTWRAAGARQPRGVLDGSILPAAAKVGDELKVEVEQELEGITVLGIVGDRQRHDRDNVIELLPTERDFQPVVETRARRDRDDRRDRGERRPRRNRDDRPPRDRDDRGGRRDRDDRRRDGGRDGGREGGRDAEGRGRRRDGGGQRRGPSFTPPPEVPQRPKPKRLRPGSTHRNAVLADLPEEQRPVAELALQGMGAVRQRLREENARAASEGRAPMPEATVLKMAEELLPRLRVAEWLDRAEAALRQLEHLDLRDLRSVVAAAGDPVVARDESTSSLAAELQAALATKQEQELQLWFGDVDAALAVGRVIRALRLSSQPPKAGVPFPADIAQRLIDSTNAALAPMDSSERWAAMLEAAAFSPVRAQIRPLRKPDAVDDELLATVRRLAPALPQVAELFEIDVDPSAPMPKPLRPGPRQRKGKGDDARQGGRTRDGGRARRESTPPATEPPTATEPAAEHTATEQPVATDSAAGPPTATEPAAEHTATEQSAEPVAAKVPVEASNAEGTATDATADVTTERASTETTPSAPTDAPEDDAPADATNDDAPAADAPIDATADVTTERASTETTPSAPTDAPADDAPADATNDDAPAADAPIDATADVTTDDEPATADTADDVTADDAPATAPDAAGASTDSTPAPGDAAGDRAVDAEVLDEPAATPSADPPEATSDARPAEVLAEPPGATTEATTDDDRP